MKKVFALVVCALIALGCTGCKKDQRPADLPEDMTPCKIILTQEGKPLADATIEFAYSTQVKYTTSGSTDENGVATMVTYGYPGAQSTENLAIPEAISTSSTRSTVPPKRRILKSRSAKRTSRKPSNSVPPLKSRQIKPDLPALGFGSHNNERT